MEDGIFRVSTAATYEPGNVNKSLALPNFEGVSLQNQSLCMRRNANPTARHPRGASEAAREKAAGPTHWIGPAAVLHRPDQAF